ncbi:Uncharacterised protein [Mycobacteroides abscessus]|nr:Uncharacterised protein [Mycobacteroides abscessus]
MRYSPASGFWRKKPSPYSRTYMDPSGPNSMSMTLSQIGWFTVSRCALGRKSSTAVTSPADESSSSVNATT